MTAIKHPGLDQAERLARFSFWHTLIFLVGVSWGFGGKIYWMQMPMMLWGSAAIVLTAAGLIHRRNLGRSVSWPLTCLLPAILYGLWVALSSFNPSFVLTTFYDSIVYRPTDSISWLPSSAIPSESRSELWLHLGLFLSAFNIALNIDRRHFLVSLLYVSTLNAIFIAIFGTVQKLTGSDIFFGWKTSPNPAFFGSFIYHNHWGPFALMNISALMGLVTPLARRSRGRGWTNSPAMAAILGIILLSMAIPLSTSRSTTILLLILLGIALTHAFRTFRRKARETGANTARPMLMIGLGLTALVIYLFVVGGPIIGDRIQATRDQLTEAPEGSYAADRFLLYADTWEIFKQHPIAGWGLETFPLMWRRMNTRPIDTDGPIMRYEDAHSDWLQSLAETGSVGTLLLLGTWWAPFWVMRGRFRSDPIGTYLLIGTSLVAVYACVEFPFANPAVVLTFWTFLFVAMRLSQLKATHRAISKPIHP